MKYTGNLFQSAEKQLIKEKKDYTMVDIIDYAVRIREWLDKDELKSSEQEKIIRRKEANRRYYLKSKIRQEA